MKKKPSSDFIPLRTFALITGAKNLKEVKKELKRLKKKKNKKEAA